MFGSFSKLPAGNIAPCRFVKLGTTAGTILQCGANEQIWGISGPGTRRAPLSGWDDGYAGISGDGAINVVGPGDDEALLDLGGTVTYGAFLKSDANGKGVAGSSDKDVCGAIALSAGVDGDRIKVKPIRIERSV